VAVTVVLLAGFGGAAYYYMHGGSLLPEDQGERNGAPLPPQAPPDLQKLRPVYTAGVQALQRDDGEEAVRQLSSFTFGTRAVEEYRLYYLANAHQLAGNDDAARLTLARLWRRSPRLIHANDAGFTLGNLYATAGDASRSAGVYTAIAGRGEAAVVTAIARWNAVGQFLRAGDLAGALYNARDIVIHHPRSEQGKDASALVRALLGDREKAALPLTPTERLERADRAHGLQRFADRARRAHRHWRQPHRICVTSIQLERGRALHLLGRYEESNKDPRAADVGRVQGGHPRAAHTQQELCRPGRGYRSDRSSRS
jgi:hypothetical protein